MAHEHATAVAQFSQAPGAPRAILSQLALMARREGSMEGAAWPTLQTLADRTGFERTTVKRAIKALEELGELYVERATRGARSSAVFVLRLLPGGIRRSLADSARIARSTWDYRRPKATKQSPDKHQTVTVQSAPPCPEDTVQSAPCSWGTAPPEHGAESPPEERREEIKREDARERGGEIDEKRLFAALQTISNPDELAAWLPCLSMRAVAGVLQCEPNTQFTARILQRKHTDDLQRIAESLGLAGAFVREVAP